MGVFESTIHFDNLDGVIDNHSSYEIKYKVTGPVNVSQTEHASMTNQTNSSEQKQEVESLSEQVQDYVYTGIVMPYSTKYFEFKQIQNEYKFSVFALKLPHEQNNLKEHSIPLQKDLKIKSQKSVCIRITPQLKVIHLTEQEIKQLQSRKAIETQFLKKSAVVKSAQLSHRLTGFFSNCPLSAELLYRASQNEFDVRKFYENHGSIDNVLLVCRTNKNKVIGGFSRPSMICPEHKNFDQKGWKNIHDDTNSSFIFSLSCNDKFTLKQGQNALFYNENNEQICFGSDQLRINNHSDKYPCLTQNINTNYGNHNYNNDTDSYRLFNGNQSSQFTTKEWEVWKLKFSEDSKEQEDLKQSQEANVYFGI